MPCSRNWQVPQKVSLLSEGIFYEKWFRTAKPNSVVYSHRLIRVQGLVLAYFSKIEVKNLPKSYICRRILASLYAILPFFHELPQAHWYSCPLTVIFIHVDHLGPGQDQKPLHLDLCLWEAEVSVHSSVFDLDQGGLCAKIKNAIFSISIHCGLHVEKTIKLPFFSFSQIQFTNLKLFLRHIFKAGCRRVNCTQNELHSQVGLHIRRICFGDKTINIKILNCLT